MKRKREKARDRTRDNTREYRQTQVPTTDSDNLVQKTNKQVLMFYKDNFR